MDSSNDNIAADGGSDISSDDQSSDDGFDQLSDEPTEKPIEDEKRERLMDDLKSLNEKLVEQPDCYQSHVGKIGILKELKMADSLDRARRTMQAKMHLPEKLWLDWIQDYKADEQDERYIEQLFQMAFQDFICPDVWWEYLVALSAKSDLFSEEGMVKARKVFEDARNAAGLHLVKGGLVWGACRDLETCYLEHLVNNARENCSSEALAAVEAQVAKMMDDFKRQLSIPLRNMESTMQECKDLAKLYGAEIDAGIPRKFEAALKYKKELEKHEKSLVKEDGSQVDGYWNYIEFEKKKADPTRVRMIFERAIADHPYEFDFWYDYLHYTRSTYKRGPAVRDLYKRAFRILSWDNKIWQDYLLVLEQDEEDITQMQVVVTDALDGNFGACDGYSEIWLTWIVILKRKYSQCEGDEQDSLRERIRTEYASACELLGGLIEDGEDGYWLYSLYSYMAILEATHFDNLPRAREIFLELMKKYRGARLMWTFWSDYYDMERRFGDVASQRSLLHKAVRGCAADNGDAEFACKKLMRFEREAGTLEDWQASQKIVDIRMSKVNRRKQRLEDNKWQKGGKKFNKSKDFGNEKKFNKSKDFGNEKKFNKSKDFGNEKKFNKSKDFGSEKKTQQEKQQGGYKQQQKQQSPQKPVQKRHQDIGDQQQEEEPSHKKTKLSPQPHEDSIDASISSFKTPTGLPPGFGKKSSSAKKSQPNVAIKNEQNSPPKKRPASQANVAKAASCEQQPAAIQMADECSSVFVSNLSYSLRDVEGELHKFFQSCGEVTNVSVARSKNGKPRGFAYVSFASSATVLKALALDRQLIHDRPVFVSPNTKKENRSDVKAFKYSDAMECHKLFVSGLSSSTTESSLHDFFAAHGTVKSARIATNRAGVSKCIAYIEYEQEKDASRAILKCDRTKLDGAEIQVAISDPPKRQKTTAVDPASRTSRTKVDFGYGRSNVINRNEKREEGETTQSSAPAKKMDNAFFASLFSKK